MHPPALCLGQRLAHDLRCDAANLDIHLQGGDSFARSGDFEIHVAVVIFRARDVGQDGVLVAFLHQSHRDSGHRSLQRNARIHQRERSPANRRHRRRTVRLQNVRDHAHRVRPLVFRRQHGRNRSLRQRSVPDFATPSSAQKCNFTNRKRRKVVVQHEAFFGFAFEGFQALHVVAGAERRRDQGLGFAASEDCAAVGAGQHSGFDPDLADLVERAAIGTPLLLDHLLAENALAQRFVVMLRASCFASSSSSGSSACSSFLISLTSA